MGEAFDRAWGLVKEEDGQIKCPLCGEIGDGNWYFSHYPECAQRYVNENSKNVEIVPNEQKDAFNQAFEAMDALGVPFDDIEPMQNIVDEVPDFETKYSGYEGLTPEQSDELMDTQERAMIDAMKRNGQIGYHPDPNVRRKNTTWRVGLHFDNDYGLYQMRKDFVENAISNDNLDHDSFAEMMIEMLEGSAIEEELKDNERTWDDVDWEKILDDELQANLEERYNSIGRGEYDEDDMEVFDMLNFVDEDQHQQKVNQAYVMNAAQTINNLVHRALAEKGIDNNYGYDPKTGMADGEGYKRLFELEKRKIISAMNDEEFRDKQPGLGTKSFDAYMKNYLKEEEGYE